MALHYSMDLGCKAGTGLMSSKHLAKSVTLEGRPLDPIEAVKADIRSKVEHPFRVIKKQCSLQKPVCEANQCRKQHCSHPVLPRDSLRINYIQQAAIFVHKTMALAGRTSTILSSSKSIRFVVLFLEPLPVTELILPLDHDARHTNS